MVSFEHSIRTVSKLEHLFALYIRLKKAGIPAWEGIITLEGFELRECSSCAGRLILNACFDRTTRPQSQLPPIRLRCSESMLWEPSSSLTIRRTTIWSPRSSSRRSLDRMWASICKDPLWPPAHRQVCPHPGNWRWTKLLDIGIHLASVHIVEEGQIPWYRWLPVADTAWAPGPFGLPSFSFNRGCVSKEASLYLPWMSARLSGDWHCVSAMTSTLTPSESLARFRSRPFPYKIVE